MAYRKVCVVLAGILLLGLIQIGLSVKCYNCTEINNKHCKDSFEKEGVPTVQCSTSQICVKHKRPGISLDVDADHRKNITANIDRGCKSKDYCKQVENFSTHCSACTEDFCNSSSAITPTFILIALHVFRNVIC